MRYILALILAALLLIPAIPANAAPPSVPVHLRQVWDRNYNAAYRAAWPVGYAKQPCNPGPSVRNYGWAEGYRAGHNAGRIARANWDRMHPNGR